MRTSLEKSSEETKALLERMERSSEEMRAFMEKSSAETMALLNRMERSSEEMKALLERIHKGQEEARKEMANAIKYIAELIVADGERTRQLLRSRG